MQADYKNMTTSHLVDLLSQKTKKFTQLLTEKKFTEEYKEYKNAIQQILSEIEFRKQNTISDPGLQTGASNASL